MASQVRFAYRYLLYCLKAGNCFAVHSPFIFNFCKQVIRKKTDLPDFIEIENRRKELLSSAETIQVTDFGGGHDGRSGYSRSVADIARQSLKPARQAQLLCRTINYFQPNIILDLGTSLGLTTLYQAAGNPSARIITFEGCSATANIARKSFETLDRVHISLVEGNLDHTLPKVISELQKVDYVYFDANHRYAPTLHYFETCLKKAHNESIFIFDDINHSEEMTRAWDTIKNHPQVTASIDLFFLGIIFFRKELSKEQFTLRIN